MRILVIISFCTLVSTGSLFAQNKFKINSIFIAGTDIKTDNYFYEAGYGYGAGIDFSFEKRNRLTYLTGIEVYKNSYTAEQLPTGRFSNVNNLKKDVYIISIPLTIQVNIWKNINIHGGFGLSYFYMFSEANRWKTDPIGSSWSNESFSGESDRWDANLFIGVDIPTYLIERLFIKFRFNLNPTANINSVRTIEEEENVVKSKFWSLGLSYKL